MSVVPAAIEVDETGRRILRSPSGATLGGPTLPTQFGLRSTHELVQTLVKYVRFLGLDGLSLGTVPHIYWRNPDDTLEFVLRDTGFQCRAELSHYVSLSNYPTDDIMQGIPAKRRIRFRKALRHGMRFTVAVGQDDIRRFYEVLRQNKTHHDATPAHSLEEIERIVEIMGEDLQIFCAELDGEIVAGLYCLAVNEKSCYTQYLVDLPHRRGFEAMRFTLFHTLARLKEQNVMFLDLGPSAILPIESTTLARFKESLGATGCERRIWTLLFS